METFLIRALQLILSLSLLVIVHEGGHFFFARLFKIRVEKFYIFFDPWFALFKYKPKHSDTEYGVGWLPLGSGNGGRSADELHPCLVYLFHDSFYMGRFVHCPERHDVWNEI